MHLGLDEKVQIQRQVVRSILSAVHQLTNCSYLFEDGLSTPFNVTMPYCYTVHTDCLKPVQLKAVVEMHNLVSHQAWPVMNTR
jgi:hypothetical protein